MNSAALEGTKWTHKNPLLLFTQNEWSRKEVMKTILCVLASEGIIYLWVYVTNEVKDFYIES